MSTSTRYEEYSWMSFPYFCSVSPVTGNFWFAVWYLFPFIPFYEIKGLTKKIKCAFADLFMCPRSASKASSLNTDEIEESWWELCSSLFGRSDRYGQWKDHWCSLDWKEGFTKFSNFVCVFLCNRVKRTFSGRILTVMSFEAIRGNSMCGTRIRSPFP